jgi:hypothetical protein
MLARGAIVLGLVLAGPAAALAAGPRCSGTVSGAVQAKFTCQTRIFEGAPGALRITFMPQKLPPELKALRGELRVRVKLQTLQYPASTLEKADLALTAARHVGYRGRWAEGKGTGDFQLSFQKLSRNLAKDAHDSPTSFEGGLLEARLPESGGGKGEVKLVVKF